MIRFDLEKLRIESAEVNTPEDAILGVVATFSLVLQGRVVYSEVDFPVVELAFALSRWLEEPWGSREDFEFDSDEAAEIGLVWVRREGSGWRIGSINQEHPEVTAFSIDDVETAVKEFVSAVVDRVGGDLGVSLAPLFG